MTHSAGYTLTIPLPEDAVPQHAIAVVAFFDAEGETRYCIQGKGETSVAGAVGLLELAKAHVLREEEWG